MGRNPKERAWAVLLLTANDPFWLAVLDASVFIGACSPAEAHHDLARAMFDSVPAASPFLVPALFRIEVFLKITWALVGSTYGVSS